MGPSRIENRTELVMRTGPIPSSSENRFGFRFQLLGIFTIGFGSQFLVGTGPRTEEPENRRTGHW